MKKIICVLALLLSCAHSNAQDLLLFGGGSENTFLGCFNCSKFDSDSVCNDYGKFGNKYATSGLWNEYAGFGNKYSSYSPWNEYSSSKSVPVLVDRDGKFYGYFTINVYRSDAINFSKDMKEWYESFDGDLEKVRVQLCKIFEK